MTPALDQFAQQIVASGLLSADELRTLLAAVPTDAQPQNAEQLARLLVGQKQLTAYQVEQLQAGQGRSLVLGNYVILDKLGQGGMGLVLKAEHRRMKRVVALKVLSPQVTRTPELLRRFQREVEAAAKLSHPNIVIAHDADEAGGTHFLVMEYVEGTDLSTLVKRNGPLPIAQALDYILQAARGLEYAHRHGVIHRDVKPANLLVSVVSRPLSVAADDPTITADHGQLTTDHGQLTTLKILDMGLARVESAGGLQDELTGSGQIMGTVDYMAPEQAANTKRADQRADIYSLGITLWYLLTGRPAYPGETAMEKLLAHQNQPIPSLRSQRPAVSPALDAVFAKMVAKTPEARYQTMTEVIAALEPCRGTASGAAADPEATLDLSSPQVATDPKTQAFLAAPRRAWRWDRRLAMLAAGVLVILVCVWLVGRGREWFSGGDVTASKDTPPKTTPAPVTNLQSEISDLKFEEPPPLDEWLKGRTILTVAQDGRGQFRTIADAVKALKPGQVVEILDQGPYRENLWIFDASDDTGIVSRAKTIIAAHQWKTSPVVATTVYAHAIRHNSGFRLSGCDLLQPGEPLPRGCQFSSTLWVGIRGSAVFEDCIVTRRPPKSSPPGPHTAVSVSFHGVESEFAMRRCNLVGSFLCQSYPETSLGSVCSLVRNWIHDYPAASLGLGGSACKALIVRENVVSGASGLYFETTATSSTSAIFQANTIAAPQKAILFESSSPAERVSWERNLTVGAIGGTFATGTQSRLKAAASWHVRDSLYWTDSDDVRRGKSVGVGTIVEEPQWLSLDPHDHRNYMRVSNPSVVLNRDGKQEYIGALPPGPAPPEGDWFTRLLARWEEVQQRIEKLDQPR